MNDSLTWVGLGIFAYGVAATIIGELLSRLGYLKAKGPMVSLSSRRLLPVFDRLASVERGWRYWATAGVIFSFVVMSGIVVAVSGIAVQTLRGASLAGVSAIVSNSVLAGMVGIRETPYWVGVGAVVALVVHEAGHVVLCRVEEIPVSSVGVWLFGLIPIGGFVKMDAEARQRAPRSHQLRIFASGVASNVTVSAVAFCLLWFLTGRLSVVPDGNGLAALSFWVAWTNLALAAFNSLPSLPLDGGRLLRTGSEAVATRTPARYQRGVATSIALGVWGIFMGSIAVTTVGLLVR